ncbi:hypothetical protein GCM10009087_31170 [Sphingomonas oligophenolica]|uniref:Uncharacterized protein n=1 Tax=Sphingomonas oligophenolica TaxID=301154 RepID=A0ABU9Y6Q5_9SPHN
MRRATFGATMMSLFAMAAPSWAETVPLSAKWTIDTSKIPAHVELRKGKVLFSAKLLPSKLVRIEGAAVAAGTGELRAAAGGQFMVFADNGGSEVYCSTKTVDLMHKGGFLYMRYDDTYMCLLDRDRDGKFELSYEIRSGLAALPFLTHGKTDDMVPITPVSYTTIDPAQLDIPLMLTLRWNIGNGFDDRLGFNVSVGADANAGYLPREAALTLSSWYGLNKGEVPGTFGFANLRIHAASTAAKTATFDIEKLSDHGTMITDAAHVGFGLN